MAFSSLRWMFGLLLVLSLAACGGSDGKDGVRGSNGQDAKPVLVKTTQEPAGLNCPSGGSRIDSGIDANLNGVLDPAEFQTVSYVCNGEDGADGQDGANGQDGADGQDGSDGLLALVQTTAISSGAECPSGGVRIDAGIDINESGSLDAAEIQQTSFVCNGSDGADGADGQDGQDGADGLSALIRTELQSPGAICPAGGIRVLSGVDANRNGQLDAGEETQTSYLCNGEAGQDGGDGFNALLASTQIPSGIQCVSGGYRIDTGLDADGNGLLDLTEVTSSFYVCNGSDGADGQDGMDGLQSLINISTEAPGANCAEGGKLIQSGVDLNTNGLLESGEVEQSAFLCNGEDGLDGLNGSDGQNGTNGQDGADGQDGLNSLVSYADEPAGANCAAGGVAVNTGLDTDADNVLDAVEIQSTTYVCHGAGGQDEQSFILQYSAQSGGSLVGTTTQEVLVGGSGDSVTAVPNSGYYFTTWSDGNTSVSRVDSNIQSDLDVVAGFSPYQYTLTYTSDSNGSISGVVGQVVFHGVDGSPVEAVPDIGYQFTQWSDGRVSNPRIDLAVEGDIAVNASFEVAQYTLEYQAGQGGEITGNANQTVIHGSDGVVVAAVPDAGYRFVQWSDGVITANRTDLAITDDLSVIAEFVEELAAPDGIQTSSIGGDLVLDWDAVPNADSYNVYYAVEPGVTPDNYLSLTGGGAVLSVSNPVVLNELDGGQRYYFVITTNIDGEESSHTQEVSSLLPNTPWLKKMHQGDLHIDPVSMTSVEVSWDESIGESYNLYVSGDPAADISQYSSYGVELRLSVASPVIINGLEVNEPVYFALERNGHVGDWTQFRQRTWGVGGPINKVNDQVLDSDGVRYVGGQFYAAGMNTGSAAAFAVNDVQDRPHVLAMPEVSGTVYAAVSDGKGGWYFGGDFTKVAGMSRLRLAHIDASGQLSSWNPGADGPVYALSKVQGMIVAGGDFLAAGNGSATIARGRFAAFDEDGLLLSWNPLFDGPVLALEQASDSLYVGGYFSSVAGVWGASPYGGLVRLSLSTKQVLTTDAGDLECVASLLASADGTVYVGGGRSGSGFRCIAGPGYLFALDGDTGISNTEWNPYINGAISTMGLKDDTLYVGGNFGLARSGYVGATAPSTKTRSKVAAFSTNSVGTLTAWAPSVSGSVQSLFIHGDTVFTSAKGPYDEETLSFYSNDVGFPLVPGDPTGQGFRVGSGAYVMRTDGGSAFVGGAFSVAGGPLRRNLAAFDSEGFLTSWNPGTDGPVNTLAISNEIIYAGGRFFAAGDGIASTARGDLAAFNKNGDLMSWDPFVCSGASGTNCNSSHQVYDIEIGGGVVYVAGLFQYAGDNGVIENRSNLAAFDVSGGLVPFSSGVIGYTRSLKLDVSSLYVGGNFDEAFDEEGASSRTDLAEFSLSGELLPWKPTVDGGVVDIDVFEGNVYVAGSFDYASGDNGTAARKGVASFTPGGDVTVWDAGLDGNVATLLVSDEQLYLSGWFNSANGQARRGLAAFSSTGSLTGWQPGTGGVVNSLASRGNEIFVGGLFSSAFDDSRDSLRSGIAAFDSSGTLLDK
jgi:hypothetical protein